MVRGSTHKPFTLSTDGCRRDTMKLDRHTRRSRLCGGAGSQRLYGNDATDASLAGQVSYKAPMGANDLVDISAAVQEQRIGADVGICRRRRIIDGPSRHALKGHLDAAAQTPRFIGGRPQCQSAHALLHGSSGRRPLLDGKKP